MSKGMVSYATMVDCHEWTTVIMSGLVVVARMDGGIVVQTNECMPSRSANTLDYQDSANILSRWLHILECK